LETKRKSLTMEENYGPPRPEGQVLEDEQESERRKEKKEKKKDRSRERGKDDDGRKKRSRSRSKDRKKHKRSRSRSKERRRRSRSRDRKHDDHKRRSKSRSQSPSATPGDIVPLDKRIRKNSKWDIPPPGCEGLTAQQVKQMGTTQAGVFTFHPGVRPPVGLPGLAPGLPFAAAGLPLPIPGAGLPLPTPAVNPALLGLLGADQTSNVYRQAKRLYVGNIPETVTEDELTHFFNNVFVENNAASADAVISTQINREKNFAFIELRTPEEATAGMAFDGVNFKGMSLKIRRPKDYQPLPGVSTDPGVYVPGVISTNVLDSPNKIFIGGLPNYFNEDQVKQLLQVFGELKAFNLVRESANGPSKGYAFCEFLDPNVTDLACQGLNGMDIGDKKLIVQRASVGAKTTGVVPQSGLMMSSGMVLPTVIAGPNEATTVLQLLNMVIEEELVDDDEYNDICEDVKEECSKFGQVKSVFIPRPSPDFQVRGVGKIFVEFQAVESCKIAQQALAGRKFAGRTVVTSFIPEEKYRSREF